MAQDGLGNLEKPRAQAENGKPARGVPKSRKKSYHEIRDGCPQLHFRVLPDRTPTGGKSEKSTQGSRGTRETRGYLVPRQHPCHVVPQHLRHEVGAPVGVGPREQGRGGVPHRVLGVLHRVLRVLHRVLGVLHRVLGVHHTGYWGYYTGQAPNKNVRVIFLRISMENVTSAAPGNVVFR